MLSFKCFVTIIAVFLVGVSPVLAESSRSFHKSSEFSVPPGLRGRVDFWISIFTKYGRDEAVIHHREYPQVVFKVLDFRKVRTELTAFQYEKYRNHVEKGRISEIREAARRLAAGARPENETEIRMAKEMEFIPGGLQKYRRLVEEQDLIRSQTGIKERYAEAVKRSGRYLPIMEQIFVNEYNLPRELTRLPFVESSFDYSAYSSVGAAGIWQFMRRTGMLYMTVNSVIDERRDPVESTRAAARYLSSAYQALGTWPLAVTSYNHGIAGVRKKVREAGTSDIVTLLERHSGRVFGFASGNFWPEFLAAVEVYQEHTKYFPGLQLEPPLAITQMKLSKPVSVLYLYKALGIKEEELRLTNYALSSVIWSGKRNIPAGYNLKVPARYRDQLLRLKVQDTAPQIASRQPVKRLRDEREGTKKTYKVRAGDSLWSISKKLKVDLRALREENNLTGNSVKAGAVLKIP